jgi:ribosomal protein L11 methyltransferase
MTWLQLRLDTRSKDAKALEDLMLDSGAVAVTLEDNGDDQILEPGVGQTPLWNQVRLTALYPADTDMHSVLSYFPDTLLQNSNQHVEILEDKDWEREWMQHYQPMQFGRRLWVCPSWLEPPEPDAINLLLEPGLAFGTGTHPTTEMCLRELDAMSLQGKTVVDYGCGSGILAVAALKLGASQALGVDYDPQALTASHDNAARNSIDPQHFRVSSPEHTEHEAWSRRADLVIANILAGPLIELSTTLLQFLRPNGTLLLSGLLQSQTSTLCDHYADRITLQTVREKEGWVCLRGSFTKREP